MAKDCKQKWWKEAKFGMFIHWGLYSELAGEYNGVRTNSIGEWIMRHMNIPVSNYEKIANRFNPTLFDANKWVELAKNAGMKYIVITAKHHDGFAMYHSKISQYNIVDATPYGKDPMKDLAKACKENDIKLCFYYSQAQDWHDPNGYGYGEVADEDKNFKKYLDEKCKPQLKELLTQYGEIGLIWFDTPMIMSKEHSQEVFDYVKSIQPNCLVSGRIGNQFGEYMSTGDNKIPSLPYFGDWEVPATLNDTWGYKYFDNNWKSPKTLLELLVKINSRGGNYLLNVGPDSKGIIPKESQDILLTIGDWMDRFGESIYATKTTEVFSYETPGIYYTRKDYKLYIHMFDYVENFQIQCLANEIEKAYILDTKEEVKFATHYVTSLNQHRVKFTLPKKPSHPIDTVVCVEMKEKEPIIESLDSL